MKPPLTKFQAKDFVPFNEVYAASEVDKLFDGAVEVFYQQGVCGYLPKQQHYHTHRAILLRPEPIRRGVTKEEIVGFLNKCRNVAVHYDEFEKLAHRIETEGIL